MSQNTGRAPMYSTTLAVDIHVKAGNNHLVAWLQAKRGDRKMQGRGTGCGSSTVSGSGKGRKLRLECLHEWALNYPAGLKRLTLIAAQSESSKNGLVIGILLMRVDVVRRPAPCEYSSTQ